MTSWRRSRLSVHYHQVRRSVFKVALKYLILLGLVGVAGGSLFLAAAFAWVSRDLPDPDALLTRSEVQSTKIFDRTGEHLLYEIHGEKKRTLIPLEEIPEIMKRATIAVEDQQFYKHSGFNPVRIIKGVVLGTILRGRPQGGSTITQQLVKNAILTSERTITRKIKELLLAIAIEQRFSKDEILQLYLNEIPYGSTNYGVESAAQSYFGKSVREMTLAEAATLAALPKAPTRYLNDAEALDARRDIVLSLMASEGYISEEEMAAAQAEVIELQRRVSNITAPHFVLYVKEQLVDDFTERIVEQGGLKVITTLDYDKQMAAEEAVRTGVETNGQTYNFGNAALVSLDPRTGEVLAMVGSKDYFDDEIDGAVNVTLRPRQPGSSIKPIVYAAGFLAGYTPRTILYDVVTTFKTELADYTPHDYHADVEFGPVTARQALQGSLNIPAVRMLALVGVQSVLDFAERLGYSTFQDRSRFGLSLVLGGGEVTLLDHVAGYAAFANKGRRVEPISILKVEGPDGELLYEKKEKEFEAVMEENVAWMVTDVLSDNAARAYIFGENNYLTLADRPVAAKTGTTNDYHDAWTVGYTPSLVAGVWVGNNDNEAMVRGADGSLIAAPIWNSYMRQALASSLVEAFNEPEIPFRGKPILDGVLPTTTVTLDRASGKLATARTPASYREEVLCGEYHSILYYVDPSDPLGPPPSDPSNHPQYENWETAITAWMERENAKDDGGAKLRRCEVPTEEDDLHIAANEPDVRLISPKSGETIDRRTLTVEVEAEARRGLSRIEFAIDGKFVASSDDLTAALTLPSWVKVGEHQLTATAFDDIDNASSDGLRFEVTAEPEAVSVFISSPLNGQTIERTGKPYTVVVELDEWEEVTAVRLTIQEVGDEEEYYREIIGPGRPFMTFTWDLPEEGNYILAVEVEDAGTTVAADPILVAVRDSLDFSAFELGQ